MQIEIVSHTSVRSESVTRLQAALGNPNRVQLHYGNGVDKLTQYRFFRQNNLNAIPFTEDPAVAREWLRMGRTVMCRARIRGQTGTGITVVEPGQELPEAKVYTEYLSHAREFRVNLLKDQLVNVREKVRMRGAEGDFHVRNRDNGYTTTHVQGEYPRQIVDLAIAARRVSESDIVGVDIGYNRARNFAFLLEVNSGPSIEGSSVQEYAAAIQRMFQQ